MPSPVAFMQQYRSLKVEAAVDDPVKKVCREQTFPAAVRKYFMMNWKAGTEQKKDYDTVTKGSKKDAWFKEYAESIRTAAMGKGAPKEDNTPRGLRKTASAKSKCWNIPNSVWKRSGKSRLKTSPPSS